MRTSVGVAPLYGTKKSAVTMPNWPNELLMAKAPRLDPAIIDAAPIDPDPQDFNEIESDFYMRYASELAAENDALQAELQQLKAKKTYDDVRIELMKPYANRVFGFLICYCLFVGVTLMLQGFRIGSFNLSDTVMAVIAGSTAASAIGLVGFVVSGLFKSKSD